MTTSTHRRTTRRRTTLGGLLAAWALGLTALAALPGEAAVAEAPEASPSFPAPEVVGDGNLAEFEVVGTDRVLVAAWTRVAGGLMVAERPAGDSWQAGVSRSEPGSRVNGGSVRLGALDDGTVLVLWQADPDETGKSSIFSRSRSPEGVWSGVTQVSGAAEDLRRMDLAVAGNRALASWFEVESGGEVYVADWSSADGWAAPERVSETGVGSGFMAVAMADDASAVVAFETYPGPGSESVINATSRSGTGGWTNPQAVSSAAGQSYDVQVAVGDDQVVHALWVLYAEPAELRLASATAGGAWGPASTIQVGPVTGNDFSHPRLAVSGEELVAAWLTPTDVPASFALATSIRSPGEDWTETAELATGVGANDLAGFAVDRRGNINAAWSDAQGTRVARYRAGRGWGGPSLVAASSDRPPVVAVDGRGAISVAMTNPDDEVLVSGPHVEAPTAAFTAPSSAFTKSSAPRLAWAAASTWTEVASTRADYRKTAWNKKLPKPRAWQPISGADAPQDSARLKALGGYTYCARVRATDDLGTTGGWSQRCVTTPLDDRALVGKGWKQSKAKGNYAKTLTSTSTRGRVLVARGAKARSIALLVRRSPKAGKVAVFQGKKRLAVVSLKGKRSTRVVVPISNTSALRKGTIKIKVMSQGKPVEIDGLFIGK